MTCKTCGAEIPDYAVICMLCGNLVHPLIDWDRLREKRRQAAERKSRWIQMEEYSEAGEGRPDWNAGQPGPDGRIPYGPSPGYRGGSDSRQGISFSNLSLLLGIVGFLTLVIPYLTVPVGFMAVLFGALGLRRAEFYKTRAIVGIVLGSCLILTGGTLIICVSALRPYHEDLIRIWEEYMQNQLH